MSIRLSPILWLVALVAGLFAGSAFAQAAPNTAILDGIADSYEAAAAGWMAPMLAYANRLFGLLLAIELGVTATKYVLEKDDARNLIAAMVGKILGVGFFYALLQFAPTWIPALMNSFRDAGAAVGGVSVLSPSAVFALGLNFVIIIFKSISDMDMWDAIGVIVMTTPAAVLIIIAFVVVAGQLLVTIIESYFVIGGASIFLGFGGSRWTQDFVQKYLGYAISVGVRLMTIYLLIGASNTLFTGWADLLRSSTSGLQFIINAWVVMGGAAFFAFLAWMIPSVASSMLSGSPSLTSGAAAGVIGGMAAGAIAGAATAGKSLATIASATADRSPGRPGAAAGLPAAVSTLSGTAPTRTNSASPQQMAPPLRSSAPATPLASGKGSDTHSSTNGNPGTHPVPVANSLVPPSSSSNASASASSSSFDASAAEANGIGGANSSGALHDASGGKDKGPSLLDRLRNVSPPQLPSDAAPGGTVHIRLDAGKD